MTEVCYTDKVTRFEDGVYRWYYDMDMYRNTSMLHTLEKVNLLIFLGISIGGALLIWFAERDASFARAVLLIGLGMGALMALLYLIGYYIAAGIMRGRHRVSFAMREDGIRLIRSGRPKGGDGFGEMVMSVEDSASPASSQRYSRMNQISNIYFSEVGRYRSYPQWNMIDMSMPGGKFQLYARNDDFDFVERYILERIPERARRRVDEG